MLLFLRSLPSLFLFLLPGVQAQFYPFCLDGISSAEFANNEPVEVIIAQAPLFSTNPAIGDKLKYLNLYHSTIIFAQGSSKRRYWTLEFDYTGGNVLKAIVPQMVPNASAPGGVSMIWNNDARFCLSNGLKWGREHWSKTYESVTNISAVKAQSAFKSFISTANGTARGMQPQYQLWRVAHTGLLGHVKQTFVEDITCNNGAIWFLHHLSTVEGAALRAEFAFRGTATILKAHRVEEVSPDDPKKAEAMVHYFQTLSDMVVSNKSMAHKFLDLMEWTIERKFVYEPNTKVYYELFGSFLPWIEFKYFEFPLMGPPWLDAEVIV